MCGRFILAVRPDIVVERFGARFPSDPYGERFNIAPGQIIPIIGQNDPSVFQMAFWGFTLHQSAHKPLINIRRESILEKSGWNRSLQNNRCIIPASGFYEWQKGNKTPFYLQLDQTDLFGLAGIYQRLEDKLNVAIITCPAPQSIRSIHHRSPLALKEKQFGQWLRSDESLPRLHSFLADQPELVWHSQPASQRVNKVANDDPSLLVEDARQASLF
jgi:putative SOS response-associated peptidase YedK